ncbi:MAG: hypothetical protein QY314_04900 [Candidatus Dojkabacteria bacterium]|nr:MAG: hypothetical protein QY314_04900 [Candidatus Dojkabacteria bacterium]
MKKDWPVSTYSSIILLITILLGFGIAPFTFKVYDTLDNTTAIVSYGNPEPLDYWELFPIVFPVSVVVVSILISPFIGNIYKKRKDLSDQEKTLKTRELKNKYISMMLILGLMYFITLGLWQEYFKP